MTPQSGIRSAVFAASTPSFCTRIRATFAGNMAPPCSRFSVTAAATWRALRAPWPCFASPPISPPTGSPPRSANAPPPSGPPAANTPRSFVTEWAVTLGIYLFVTTTLVQAYVIPTGSMEGTLRVGDHMLVDRVTFADPGPLGATSCRIAS